MTTIARPKVFGTGLIALDLVVGPEQETHVRSWAGGTCGSVLSILAYLGWDACPVARMNDDVSSDRVCADMQCWGVHMDWANCAPTAHAPMIVQEIRHRRDGQSNHRFSWSCPRCAERLPPFKALTLDAAEKVKPALPAQHGSFQEERNEVASRRPAAVSDPCSARCAAPAISASIV